VFVDEIRLYFGETIAMYFAFLGYYTFYLAPLAVLGIVAKLYFAKHSLEFSVVLSCIFNIIWATIFLEAWKRKTAELAYQWGTIDTEQFEEPRAAYYGDLEKDPVTGRLQPQYSNFRRLLKFYCVSVPVMILGVIVAWLLMLFYFFLEDVVKPLYRNDPSIFGTCVSLIPNIVYAVIVQILIAIYRPLAVALNDWGNDDILLTYFTTAFPSALRCLGSSSRKGIRYLKTHMKIPNVGFFGDLA